MIDSEIYFKMPKHRIKEKGLVGGVDYNMITTSNTTTPEKPIEDFTLEDYKTLESSIDTLSMAPRQQMDIQYLLEKLKRLLK